MRVTVTGATGLIGRGLVSALLARGDEVTVLTRDPDRARATLAAKESLALQAAGWELASEPAPAQALSGRDAVVHLAGENVAQRWSASAKRSIRDSRLLGTRNLIAGLERAGAQAGPSQAGGSPDGERPRVLISSSAVGYYGPHGEEPLDEDAPPGDDFLARVCADWEAAADGARALGTRVVQVRTGVVLDRGGGALGKMLPAFRLGVGGPVASGRQFISWIHRDDVIGMMLAAIDDERWSGPVNATAPEPVCNRDFSHALGRALGRPALLPVPALALRLLYGDMAEIVTTGARAVPAKALVLGYEFSHPQLEPALRAALAQGSRSQ
jgi:uncharacterized protein (TIGR01777 family)